MKSLILERPTVLLVFLITLTIEHAASAPSPEMVNATTTGTPPLLNSTEKITSNSNASQAVAADLTSESSPLTSVQVGNSSAERTPKLLGLAIALGLEEPYPYPGVLTNPLCYPPYGIGYPLLNCGAPYWGRK